MIKKHYIGRLLAKTAAIFLITYSAVAATDKVVVIPLGGGSGDSGGVSTVTSADDKVWMDCNLGALRVATKSDDSQAYGSFYQWGRLGDGHEYRESPVTSTLSPGDVPGHGHFISVNAAPYDWTAMPNNNLWLGASGINNPCPAGFRLPTETEWETERASWGSNNAAGAFASLLRLVMVGWRDYLGGAFVNIGIESLYWSSTVNTSQASALAFNGGNAVMLNYYRAMGNSVRCIKD